MPPSTTLECFLTLARRPHAHCLHNPHAPSLTPTLTQWPRCASNLPPSSRFKPTLDPNAHQPPTVTSIPLHIGLDRNPTQRSAISKIPIPKGIRGETFTPSVLSAPLGLPHPPQPGQNSTRDMRSWDERRSEFSDRTKVLERRRVYLRSYLRPYFQEWKRMDYHRGKSFVANERMVRRDKALYFPNLVGETLDGFSDVDSCGVMMGKVSIVGMQMGRWAEEQVLSFVGEEMNPVLRGIVRGSQGMVQRVHVNMQASVTGYWLVKMFRGNLKKMIPEDEWGRYFLVKLPRDVRRGLSEEARDAMGLLNSQVGYVYLVDSEGKIRWAGSGDAWEGEREGLNAAVQRLIAEEEELKRGGGRGGKAVGSVGVRKTGHERTATEKPKMKAFANA